MRISLFLAALLALTASGCDSVEEAAADAPTIEFGASSASAAESDTGVEIPVKLTGGQAGQTYTVEVLYADAASKEASGDSIFYDRDFTNFGEASGANRVARVQLTGESDTQVVTLDVVDDGQSEAPESAIFVLQQATNGAVIGRDRQFQLDIGTPSIADIRTRDNLTMATVEGVVTRTEGGLTYLQDGTGGIAVFAFSDSPFGEATVNGAISAGTRVQVTGKLCEFGVAGFPDNVVPGGGLKQIVAPSDECFTPADVSEGEITFSVVSEENVPSPQKVTLATLAGSGDSYESELVCVTDLTFSSPVGEFEANRSYTVTDASGSLTLRTPRAGDGNVDGEAAPTGPFAFVGVIGQFRDGNQLTPIETTDIQADNDCDVSN